MMILTSEERRFEELNSRLDSRFAGLKKLSQEIAEFRRMIEAIDRHIATSLRTSGYEASHNYELDTSKLALLKEKRAIAQAELDKQNAEIQDFSELVARCKTYLQDQRRERIEAEGQKPPRMRQLGNGFSSTGAIL